MPKIADQAIADAEQLMFDAYHMNCSYAERADRLTRWKRILDFVSLGVAPGIVFVVVDKPYVRETGLIVAGLCSVAAYVWAAFGFAFRWERQLEVAQNASVRARQVFHQLRTLLVEIRARNAQENGKPEDLVPSINKISEQYEELYNEIQDAGVDIKPWMSLLAQQRTMLDLNSSCAVCGRQWDRNKHHLFTANQAKHFLRIRQKKWPNSCATCGFVELNAVETKDEH